MKKSNYLNYLNEYNHLNVPQDVQKMFLNVKKHPKSKTNKSSKNKDSYLKPIHNNTPYLTLPKRAQNKENIDPNFITQLTKNQKFMKKSQSLLIKPQKIIEPLQKQQIKQNPAQIHKNRSKSHKLQVLLTRCNFQPSHQSDNLYLVETQTSKQLIVCEKCAEMFSKRIKLSQFKRINQQEKHSYSELFEMYEFYEQQAKKLRRIKLIQRQNMNKNINKVSSYYGMLIQRLSQLQNEVQTSIYKAYESNVQILDETIQKNVEMMRILDDRIEKMQKRCVQNVFIQEKQSEKIQQQQLPIKLQNKRLQLVSLDIHIPQQIVQSFFKSFQQSKYCIKLNQNNKHDEDGEQQQIQKDDKNIMQSNKPVHEIKSIPQQQQQHTQQQSQLSAQNEYDQNLNFEQQLPFKVHFPITSTKSSHNKLSQKLYDDPLLSKISSSQQLLIESLRQHQFKQLIKNVQLNDHNVQNDHNDDRDQKHIVNEEELMKNSHDNLNNFRTQASTYRPQTELLKSQESQSYSRQNFIKNLHNIESNDQIDDMLCDQDLTLSYSHPIYQNNPIQPRKSLKLTKKSSRNNLALTLSQLQSQIDQQEKRNSIIIKSQITNPSIITASQNKQDISFQLDENLIIDGNILPEDNDGYQNLDIISPAFKII